jgi:predicted polyphosphate/ATP-dependent NAD kinase
MAKENKPKKKLGLIINPLAGIGGAVGLKGSDGAEIQRLARERGAVRRSGEKAMVALERFREATGAGSVEVCTASGPMGGYVAQSLGFPTKILMDTPPETTAGDTTALADMLARIPVDVILFAGGDGTARDVYAGVHDSIPVIGIPAGVKIHSGVYATSPSAAGDTLAACMSGDFRVRQAEVMDIDEDAYREGRLTARLYGYMAVPAVSRGMQHPKAASHNSGDDVAGICFEIEDRIAAATDPKAGGDSETCFVFGAGSTVRAVMDHLGLDGTLIGVDVMRGGKVILADATARQLAEVVQNRPARLIVTAIGGQGHIFGRGNQQLSPDVIRAIGLDNIWVVAAASKIYSLEDQMLYVDTGDGALDEDLRGYRRVIIGKGDELMCRVL